jgi:Fe-S cluster assembly protein SufD
MSLASVIARSRQDRESWKYTSLAPLAVEKFAPPAPFARQKTAPEMALPSIVKDAGERHQIVFLNGVWRPELSKLGELEGIMEGDNDAGYSLKLAGQTCLVTAPVELVFLTEAAEPTEIDLQLLIELGASGRLTLIEHHTAPKGQPPIAGVYETEIRLGPQAKLVHGRIIDVGAPVSSLARTRAEIGEGAYYDNFQLIKSGKLIRSEIEAKLTGKMAQCTLNGAMLLGGDTHADTTTHIIHAAPFGTSREIYKSVVAGKARGVFQGKITVEEGAQKTDSAQLSRALLLSDQAEMDTKPELKIYADDVKCSHGAAVGALDADMLFYLRARGLDETQARALLIRGFVGEIIDEIHMPEWRDYLRLQVEAWCHEQN